MVAYPPVRETVVPIRIGGCASVAGATAHASAARKVTAPTFLALVTGFDSRLWGILRRKS